MEQADFFRDTAFQLANAIQGLWTLNLTVLLAAVGLGVSSRERMRGLSPAMCAVATLSLLVFFGVSFDSLNGFYLRANDAAEALQQVWPGGQHGAYYAQVVSIFAPTDEVQIGGLTCVPFLLWTLVVEVLAAVGIGVLLSNFGRTKA